MPSISSEMIERAARALADRLVVSEIEREWDDMDERERDGFRADARAALQAALKEA